MHSTVIWSTKGTFITHVSLCLTPAINLGECFLDRIFDTCTYIFMDTQLLHKMNRLCAVSIFQKVLRWNKFTQNYLKFMKPMYKKPMTAVTAKVKRAAERRILGQESQYRSSSCIIDPVVIWSKKKGAMKKISLHEPLFAVSMTRWLGIEKKYSLA